MFSCLTQAYDSINESETVWTSVWGTTYTNINIDQGIDKLEGDELYVPTLQDIIYTGSSAGNIKLYYIKETSNNLELKYICKQNSPIICLLLNVSNTILISKTLKGTITIFDTFSMDIKYRFKISSTVRNVNMVLSIDELYILAESDNKSLSFYDITNSQITSSYEVGENFTSFILSNKGDTIIVGYENGNVNIFDCVTGDIKVQINNNNIGSVTCLTVCNKSFNLLIGYSSGIIKHYTQTNGELIHIYEKPHKTNIISIVINPNNKCFASLSNDSIIKIWNFNNTLPEYKIKTHKELSKHIKYKINDNDNLANVFCNNVYNIRKYLVHVDDNVYNFIPNSLQQIRGQLLFSKSGNKLVSVIHQFIVIHLCPKSQSRI